MNIRSSVVLIIFLVLGFCSMKGQSTQIKGNVIDSTAVPLIGATIVLLQSKDSVMVSYALTNTDGDFVLNKINSGEYYLQITYIGYGNYRQKVLVDNVSQTKNLGTIFLSPENILLERVLVKAEHIPIIIKNDTIEYNAAAFKTKPNAPVEDLLKKLPGVDVQRDGSIKAQGETVENVFVDGKEFFGNDPTIATRNLPADVIDAVQVYDKASEMAEFSGIDDGMEEKTINLTLKEDKKKGIFGNIEGGFGADDPSELSKTYRHSERLSLNRFTDRSQISVLGMTNNTNDPGFSLNDYFRFMGGMGRMMNGSQMTISMNSQDTGIPIGNNRNPGITKTAAGGFNFNLDVNKKVEWQSSYFLNQLKNHTTQSINSQNLTANNQFRQLKVSDRINTQLNHQLSTSLRVKFTPSFQLTWVNRLSMNTSDVSFGSSSQTMTNIDELENQSNNQNDDIGAQYNWLSDLSIRKKLKKDGRVLSAKIDINLGDNSSDNHVDNELEFFTEGMPIYKEEILQNQENNKNQTNYGLTLRYTEPLAERLFLGFKATKRNSKNTSIGNYFDLDPNNPSIRSLNTLLSNHFIKDYNYDQLGSDLRFVGKVLNISCGISYQHASLKTNNVSDADELTKDFNYFLPNFNIEYKIATSTNLMFSYRTSILEPGMSQLQPKVSNTDPVNLYQGNPNLKSEYIHEGNIHFLLFDQFTFTSLFANLNTKYTLNKIVNETNVDELFRQTIMPVNTKNNFNTNAYFSFSTPLKFIKSKVSFDVIANYNRGILFVDDMKNNTHRWTNNYTITLENRKKELFDLAVGLSIGTSDIKYSENEEFDQNYFDQTYFTDLSLSLPKNWTFNSSLDYTHYSAESFGSQDELFIWQGGITKRFSSKERWTIELNVYDILNQNQGIDRSNNLNYIQESRTNVLGRYFMLGIKYKLSNFSGNEGMQIEMKERRGPKH